ncbi:MAG: STAS domain-containing protein [Candidatus Wenzhouxiangella sp. M2_3B_020]
MADDDEQTVRLEGRLTVDEVPHVYEQRKNWRDDSPPATIDLADLEAADSSAVALLLEWQSWARGAGNSIRFANPPESLRTLAGLSQVDEMLGWKNE